MDSIFAQEKGAAPLGEFEAFPFAGADLALFSSQLSFSTLHNAPLRVISPAAREHAHQQKIKELSGLTFEEFCVVSARNWLELKPIFDSVRASLFVTRPTGASPLVRLLRDHWLWQWFEITQIYASVLKSDRKADPVSSIRLMGGSKTFLGFIIAGDIGEHKLILGPDVFSTDQFVQEKKVIGDLTDDIYRILNVAWDASGQLPFSRNLPRVLHSNETLFRAAVSRYPKSLRDAQSDAQRLTPMVRDLAQYLRSHDMRVSFSAITRLAALISALNSWLKEEPATQSRISTSMTGLGDEKLRHVSCDFRGGAYFLKIEDYPSDRSGSRHWLFEHRLEAGVSHWRNQVYESTAILSRWLNAHLGSDLSIPDTIDDAAHSTIWHRLARYISTVFNCAQVALYRLGYEEEALPLRCFAAVSHDVHSPQEKMVVLANHMSEIAGDQERRSTSVAYRSADNNRQEYVKGWDVSKGLRPVAQHSCPPVGTQWSQWGVTVMATPIRVNGIPWGIIECVGDIPNAFSSLVRSEIEELSAILSPFFFLNSVITNVEKFTELIADSGIIVSEKLRHIEQNIDALLMCLGSAIFRYGADAEPLNVFSSSAFSGRDFKDKVSAEVLRRFFQSSELVMFFEESDLSDLLGGVETSEFSSGALIKLRSESDTKSVYCILLLFPFPIRREVGWIQTYIALGGFLLSIIKLLTSEITWSQEIRPYMAHQMSSRTRSLSGRMADLQRALKPHDISHIYQITYDIQDAIDNLRIYTESMKATDQRFKSVKQARMFAIEEAIRSSKVSSGVVDFRAAWLSASHMRSNELAARSIKIGDLLDLRSNRAPDQYFVSGVFVELIGEVFDNCAKYSVVGDVVRGRLYAEGGHTHLTIMTIGPKIDDDEREHIFEHQYRAEYAREQHRDRGSGRGLAYAKDVMNLFKGDIDHVQETILGTNIKIKGASAVARHEFTFTLPKGTKFKQVMDAIRRRG